LSAPQIVVTRRFDQALDDGGNASGERLLRAGYPL
jgi:hypothetical protein